MKNKTRIITRIIACLLAIIIALGLIIPAVSAAELSGEPTGSAPSGFEYVQNEDGSWSVIKYADNTAPAIMLYGQPEVFDTIAVTVFIGNLVTGEVKTCTLSQYQTYINSLDLDDGYYVIYGGKYAWSDKNGNLYSVLPDRYIYMYVGDSGFDANMFKDVEFITDHSDVIQLEVAAAVVDAQIIDYNSQLTVSPIGLHIPDDAIPKKQEENTDPTNPNENTDETTPSTPEEDPNQPTEKPEEPEEKVNILKNFFDGMKESLIMIILIVGCWITLKIIKARKIAKIAEQTEKDQYDDKRLK